MRKWVITIVASLAVSATAAARPDPEPREDAPPDYERMIGNVRTLRIAGLPSVVSSEQVANDEAGRAEAFEPAHQMSLELEASTAITSWLSLDAKLTFAPGDELIAIAQLSYAW